MIRTFKFLFKTVMFFISILVVGAVVYFGYQFYLQNAYPDYYKTQILKASDEYSVEPALIYAIIKTESNFKEKATSKAGAVGLMQLMPATFSWLQSHTKQNIEDDSLYEPDVNINYGTYLLSFLLDRYNSEETAICAYNAGMGTVDNWLKDKRYSDDGITLKNIPYKETNNYVKRVIKSRDSYRNLYFKNTGRDDDDV